MTTKEKKSGIYDKISEAISSLIGGKDTNPQDKINEIDDAVLVTEEEKSAFALKIEELNAQNAAVLEEKQAIVQELTENKASVEALTAELEAVKAEKETAENKIAELTTALSQSRAQSTKLKGAQNQEGLDGEELTPEQKALAADLNKLRGEMTVTRPNAYEN